MRAQKNPGKTWIIWKWVQPSLVFLEYVLSMKVKVCVALLNILKLSLKKNNQLILRGSDGRYWLILYRMKYAIEKVMELLKGVLNYKINYKLNKNVNVFFYNLIYKLSFRLSEPKVASWMFWFFCPTVQTPPWQKFKSSFFSQAGNIIHTLVCVFFLFCFLLVNIFSPLIQSSVWNIKPAP